MNPLADLILAARAGGAPGVAEPDRALTNADLVAAARAVADDVERVAGRPSPVVAVSLPLGVDAVVHVLAAIIGHYSLCVVDPGAAAVRRAAVLDALRPDVTVDADGAQGAAAGTHRRTPPEPGYVAMSSGSTGGGPKGVLSPWSAIAAFVGAGAEALELDRDSRWAEISHPAYDMSMTNLLVALASGAEIQVSRALGDQVRPLRFIDRVAATHVRLAPRFIELAAAERRARGTSALRVWASGGDRLRSAHVEQAFGFGIPVVINTYGTSETIGFASAARFAASADIPSVRGAVSIGPGAVGAWSTTLSDTGEGRMLSISSPHLPSGYLFGEAIDYPAWSGDGSVLTGDIGVRADGVLYCLGRAGRRVKRSGSFVDLDQVDETLRRERSLPVFTVLTLSGELVSMVEGSEDDIDGLRRALASQLRPEVLPDLVAATRLPRLDNGKIDHRGAADLAETLLAGAGAGVAPESSSSKGEW